MTASDDPRQMLRAAVLHERAGRLADAAAVYERVLARWPDLPDSWYNLGIVQRKLLRFDEALDSYAQALKRGVTQPEQVYLNRAVIYADHLRREEQAEIELHAALAVNPNYVPALLNLANLNEDLGNRDQALALYARVLALDSRCLEALARYASVATVSGTGDPLVSRLRQAFADPIGSAADRASVGFALGKILDACGVYDAAFDAYLLANRLSRESAGPRALYNGTAQERLVDQIIAQFAGKRAAAASGAATPRPIFICGMFRSGSTLAERVLAGHRQVTAGGEIDSLPQIVQSQLMPFPASMTHLSPEQLVPLAVCYRQSLAKMFPHADYVTDKRPDNFLYIGLIKSMFPDARIVHTVREPLDTCLSVFFLHLDQGKGYALDLMDIGHYYRQYRRLMGHWKALYGEDIVDFNYDAFVRQPRPAVTRLLDGLGLDWDEQCLSMERSGSVVKTASVWQVREPLYQGSSGRWRNYRRQLAPLREYLVDLEPLRG